MKEKIEKLLRLARDKGATEHEAASAMRMAARLMTEHGISEAELGDKKLKAAARMGQKLNRELDRYESWIMNAAGKLYGCDTIRRPDGLCHFVGRPDHMEIAEITRVWLTDQVEAFYKQALPRGLTVSARANFRRTFKEACSLRVFNRAVELVKEMKNGGVGNSTALTVAGYFEGLHAENRAVMASVGITTRSRASRINAGSGSAAGAAYGDKVQLRREVR